ncbi:Shedu immune nuclease family protein [Nocardia sp. NBC_01327]|uniref:Shedu immune nuclease family protein n=1 Tax=Nocardia sp. NBC_01327 TaxID=2903593 RepID=UPI002E0D2AA6|nr:DUF4263 domain-containing protein [Nocardia sp. NBC_01327]
MTQPVYGELLTSGDKEFSVASDDFSRLEIRQHPTNRKFHYFYDTYTHRLVSDFVLYDGQRVATICTVSLIRADDDHYTPRLRFWKKDKTKPGREPLMEQLPMAPEFRMVKAAVDTDDGHRNLWKLINYLQACTEIALPHDQFRIVTGDTAQLIEQLKGSKKDVLVEAMAHLIRGSVTQADLDLIADRRGQLQYFEELLTEKEFFATERARRSKNDRPLKPEALWQAFFQDNPWIFGYGLTLISCDSYDSAKLEVPTTGANAFTGAGKRVDALLRTRGHLSSLLFCEIKRHDTKLLENKPLAEAPDVYLPANELVGAVSQVQKTADKAIRAMGAPIHRAHAADGTPAGFEVAAVRPRQAVVVGMTSQFETDDHLNEEKVSSFELYRRSIDDVEIITFDELLARARFIVADGKSYAEQTGP